MKNLFFLLILLVSTAVSAQDPCVLDDTVLDQSESAQTFSTSDETYRNGQNILADDFTLSTTRSVNSVCLIGKVIDYDNYVRRGISTRSEECDPDYLIISYFPHNVVSGLPVNVPIMSYNITPVFGAPVNVPNLGEVCTITGTHAPLELPADTYWVSMYSSYANNSCILEVAVPYEEKGAARGTNNKRMTSGYAVIPVGGGGGSPFLISTMGTGFSIAVGALPAAAIPTLSEWGLIILAMVLMIAGVSFIRRKITTVA